MRNVGIPAVAGLLLLAHAVIGKNCRLPDNADRTRPSADFFDSSFSASIEVTSTHSKNSYVIEEWYNKEDRSGRLQYRYKKGTWNVYIFEKNEEVFVTSDDEDDNNCVSLDFDTFEGGVIGNAEWAQWISLKKPSRESPFGPMSIFARLTNVSNKIADADLHFQGSLSDPGGIPRLKWISCEGDQESDYIFTDPEQWTAGGGDNMSVPLRYKQDSFSATVFGYTRRDVKIEFPAYKGCTRDRMARVPDIASIAADVELIMQNDGKQNITVDKFSIYLDSGKTSFLKYNMWRQDKENQLFGQEKNIIDEANGIAFSLSTDNEAGSIKCSTHDIKPSDMDIILKDGTTIDIQSLLTLPQEAYSMGERDSRGLMTRVFEVTFDDPTWLKRPDADRFVVTYFVGKIKDENKLITVTITGYKTNKKDKKDENENSTKQKRLFTMTLDLYYISNLPEDLYKELDIRECNYDLLSDKHVSFFQVTFGVTGNSTGKDIDHVVANRFLEKLYREYEIEPTRIPEVIVNSDADAYFVTAMLLERPFTSGAYKQINDVVLKEDSPKTKVRGIMSNNECLLLCLAETECNGLSYCDGTCVTTQEPDVMNKEIKVVQKGCSAFQRQKDKQRHVRNSVDILSDLEIKIEKNQEPMVLEIGSLTLTSEEFEENTNFRNLFSDASSSGKTSVETGFSRIAIKKKLVESDVVPPTALSKEDCYRSCENRDTCESLSWCYDSQQCVLSSKHFPEDKEMINDTACEIIQKLYIDQFRKLDGLVLEAEGAEAVTVANENECAQNCVSQDDRSCQSFDSCQRPDKKHDCVLYETHFRKPGIKVKEGHKCAHYSRKFIYDFRKIKSSKSQEAAVEVIRDTTLEDCAQRCEEASTFDCKAFDFHSESKVKGTGSCRFKTVGKNATLLKSPDTDFYYFEPMLRGTPLKVSYASGTVFWLCMLMVVLGGCLGAAGYVGYLHLKG